MQYEVAVALSGVVLEQEPAVVAVEVPVGAIVGNLLVLVHELQFAIDVAGLDVLHVARARDRDAAHATARAGAGEARVVVLLLDPAKPARGAAVADQGHGSHQKTSLAARAAATRPMVR